MDWEEALTATGQLNDTAKPALHDLWTILFTSGTTGSPKGVMLSYYAAAAMMENERVNNTLQIFSGKAHRFFSYLPLNHIAERIIVEMAAILTGGTISFGESLNTFARNLRDTRPTLFLAVPRIWAKFQIGILEKMSQRKLNTLLRIPGVSGLVKKKIRKGLGLDQARILLTGAAPTPDALKAFFLRLSLPIQEVYAMTENCGGCALMPKSRLKPGAVGKPLPNVDLRIAPETGEVLMRAPWNMSGYYKDPDKTAEVLQDGWLHTGDQGEIDEEGFLRLTGRVTDTFKSAKGKFIVPAPIEWGFAENPLIEQICVTGRTIPQPLALVVLSERGLQAPREWVQEQLRLTLQEVNATLAKFECIKSLVILQEPWTVDNGVLTPTLKIRREVLNQRFEDRFWTWYARQEEIIWESDPMASWP
jgi:long-subunit acyl-CoA synthetase (AMP-forming)